MTDSIKRQRSLGKSNSARIRERLERYDAFCEWLRGKNVSHRDVAEYSGLSFSAVGRMLRDLTQQRRLKSESFIGTKFLRFCRIDEHFHDNIDLPGIEETIKQVTKPRGGIKRVVENEIPDLPANILQMMGYTDQQEPAGRKYSMEDIAHCASRFNTRIEFSLTGNSMAMMEMAA